MRELPPPGELLRARDAARIEYVGSEFWRCPHCPVSEDWLGSTVEWATATFGRCRECGQKFVDEG